MRILVLSDIHGNYQALRAVLDHTSFDQVLCLGDLVDFGPEPKACIDVMRQYSHTTVRGNHDQAMGKDVDCRSAEPFRRLAQATRKVTRRTLTPSDLIYLSAHPLQTGVELGGIKFWMLHSAPSDPLFARVDDEDPHCWAKELNEVQADVLLAGHTHVPQVRRVGRKSLINPGSVGQPRDGDPRASYCLIDDGEARLCRVEYDIEALMHGLEALDLERKVLEDLTRMVRTGGKV